MDMIMDICLIEVKRETFLYVDNGDEEFTESKNELVAHKASQVWRMCCFSGPILGADYTFQNLQTLEIVENISNSVIDTIPNIKKLGIAYVRSEDDEDLSHSYGKLAHCHKLETLKLSGAKLDDMKNIKFPDFLRKLVLTGCKIPRRTCGFGSLPNLEVLITSCSDFEYCEWNTVEREFPSLKILLLVWRNLKKRTTEDCSHFHSLEHLSLNGLQRLKDIPGVFGESIKLINCSRSAYISAKQILDQQQNEGGNYDLTVKVVHDVRFLMDDKKMRADLEGMASDSDNFHVTLRD